MKLTKEEVLHIARLACLHLNEQEVEKFQKQLSEILDYFEILQKARIKEKFDFAYPLKQKNIFREDKILPSSEEVIEKIFAQAPRKNNKFFEVFKII